MNDDMIVMPEINAEDALKTVGLLLSESCLRSYSDFCAKIK